MLTPGLSDSLAAPVATVFQQSRRQRGPTRLMARSEPLAGVAVKELVEEQEILPVRIGGRSARPIRDRRVAALVGAEKSRQPGRQLPRASRRFISRPEPVGHSHPQCVAIEMVVSLQRLDEEVVHRQPDRPRQFELPPNSPVAASPGS